MLLTKRQQRMQSDRNRFCGDVVLDSIAYRDEDIILDQIYEN